MKTCVHCDRQKGHDGSCLHFDEMERYMKCLDYSNPFHVEVECWFVGRLSELLTEARRLKKLAGFARHMPDCPADNIHSLRGDSPCKCGLDALGGSSGE